MPQSLNRYAFDSTGVDPNNRVQNEEKTLSNRRVRAIAPLYGYFYTNDFLAIDMNDGRHLVHGIDYVFAELSTTISVATGKEAVGIALVINQNVSSQIKIDYQVVGGVYEGSMQSLVNLLEMKADDAWSSSYWDVKNRPTTFVPSPHLHDLGDGFGFETVVFALEKLRSAILWADSTAIDSMLKMIDDYLAGLTNYINHRVDTELIATIIEFKNRFTKELVGLGKVENLPVASAEDGMEIASPDYRLNDLTQNKYIATQALAGFKEVMYSYLVSANVTNLGRSYGVIGLPLKSVLTSLTNGARILMESVAVMRASGVGFDEECYPDNSKDRARWSIVKVSNNEKDRGGVLLGFNMTTGEIYTGSLVVTALATNVYWKRTLTTADSDTYLKDFTEHLQNTANPHKTRKVHVGLGDVENLPIATREDIICRKPKRAYVTYDGLLLFWKAFMTGVKDMTEITEDDTSPNAIAKYQIMFAPCGPCGDGCADNYSTVPPTTQAPEPPRPRGELLVRYCIGFKQLARYSDGFGGSYEEVVNPQSPECGYIPENTFPVRGSLIRTFCEEGDKIGEYADGGGGKYTRVMEANSPSCIPGSFTGTYEFLDEDGVLYAYGFAPTDVADPDATVIVYNDEDQVLCRVYSQAGPGREVQVRDTRGQVIGYGLNPTTP